MERSNFQGLALYFPSVRIRWARKIVCLNGWQCLGELIDVFFSLHNVAMRHGIEDDVLLCAKMLEDIFYRFPLNHLLRKILEWGHQELAQDIYEDASWFYNTCPLP